MLIGVVIGRGAAEAPPVVKSQPPWSAPGGSICPAVEREQEDDDPVAVDREDRTVLGDDRTGTGEEVGVLLDGTRRIAAAILEFLTGPLAANPASVSEPLAHGLAGYRGDYRVVIRLDKDGHAVLVARIDHRADLRRLH